MGVEKGPEFYDEAFAELEEYQLHYSMSRYLPQWVWIARELQSMGDVRILEIGCGPGQFAELLYDRGIRNYTGFDFSPVAIDKARERTPSFTFEVQDARDASVWRRGFDCAVCLEVLEHIVDDLSVLSAIPPGTRFIGSVPRFDSEAHVRYFATRAEVKARYGRFLENVRVVRICNIYIFVGVKRDVPLGRARAAVEATAWHLGHAVRESARWIRAGRERLKTR